MANGWRFEYECGIQLAIIKARQYKDKEKTRNDMYMRMYIGLIEDIKLFAQEGVTRVRVKSNGDNIHNWYHCCVTAIE